MRILLHAILMLASFVVVVGTVVYLVIAYTGFKVCVVATLVFLVIWFGLSSWWDFFADNDHPIRDAWRSWNWHEDNRVPSDDEIYLSK